VNRLAGCMDRGLDVAREAWEQGGQDAQDLQAVKAPRRPSEAVTAAERREPCLSWQEAWPSRLAPVPQPCATIMSSCEPGVLVGSAAAAFPMDTWD
jgi:hypothetical protein